MIFHVNKRQSKKLPISLERSQLVLKGSCLWSGAYLLFSFFTTSSVSHNLGDSCHFVVATLSFQFIFLLYE